MRRIVWSIIVATALVVPALQVGPATAGGGDGGDTLVSVGSPMGPFSQNKQNEPAVAIDQADPNVVAAGANDNIDMELCNAGPDTDCPFTPGVGGSGIYFSFDSGATWTQPTYTGLTARSCTGVVGDDDPLCEPTVGPIGTLPNYYEQGLASDGDPALAFGPAPGPGGFSYDNGSRLYYANLTSALPGEAPFKGFEAIAVSHTDDVQGAAAGENEAWSDPVIASKQNSALFADKEQIWADNAESSPHFGNAYVCYAGFRGINGTSQPLFVLSSRDGGQSWTQRKVTPATNNISSKNGFGRSGCTIRTDSEGVVYVFDYQFAFDPVTSAPGVVQMIRSFDGGRHWTRPRNLFTILDGCAYVEPSIGRCVMDGVGGARDDLMPVPSVDIANGAPSGEDATDQIVLATTEQQALNDERVMFTTSTNGGNSWSPLLDVTRPGDRGYYAAPAISPDGTDVWLVYNAFLERFKQSAEGPANDRPLDGVVLHADVSGGGTVGPFTLVHRGASGDARGSSQNDLAAEFLGDYVYAAATRDYGTMVWNDVRRAVNCPAVDEYRQELHEEAVATGVQTAEPEEPRGAELRDQRGKKHQEEEAAPAVQENCPTNFGNSDIFGGSYLDPTP